MPIITQVFYFSPWMAGNIRKCCVFWVKYPSMPSPFQSQSQSPPSHTVKPLIQLPTIHENTLVYFGLSIFLSNTIFGVSYYLIPSLILFPIAAVFWICLISAGCHMTFLLQKVHFSQLEYLIQRKTIVKLFGFAVFHTIYLIFFFQSTNEIGFSHSLVLFSYRWIFDILFSQIRSNSTDLPMDNSLFYLGIFGYFSWCIFTLYLMPLQFQVLIKAFLFNISHGLSFQISSTVEHHNQPWFFASVNWVSCGLVLPYLLTSGWNNDFCESATLYFKSLAMIPIILLGIAQFFKQNLYYKSFSTLDRISHNIYGCVWECFFVILNIHSFTFLGGIYSIFCSTISISKSFREQDNPATEKIIVSIPFLFDNASRFSKMFKSFSFNLNSSLKIPLIVVFSLFLFSLGYHSALYIEENRFSVESQVDSWNFRPRVVASLTSTPSRIQLIEPCIDALLAQTLIPDRIYVNLPDFSLKENRPYPVPPFLNKSSLITVIRGTDWGPSTKLIPAVLEEQDPTTIIITFDDDRLYHPDTVKTLVKWSLRHPTSAIGYWGWKTCNKNRENCFRFNGRDSKQYWVPENMDILSGFGSVLYRVGFFDRNFLTNYDMWPKGCRIGDDLWISANLALNQIPRITVPSIDHPDPLFEALSYQSGPGSLHSMGLPAIYNQCSDALRKVYPFLFESSYRSITP